MTRYQQICSELHTLYIKSALSTNEWYIRLIERQITLLEQEASTIQH